MAGTTKATNSINTGSIAAIQEDMAVMSVQENPQLTQQRDLRAREMAKAKALEELQNTEFVTVKGSPMYRPYFGNNMPIVIQGFPCYIPLDGKAYKVRKPYADVFNERLARIDALEQQRGVMANTIEESYAGEAGLGLMEE